MRTDAATAGKQTVHLKTGATLGREFVWWLIALVGAAYSTSD